ncbi:DLW-39 family protein [Nesterenkonia flava]|uniref:DLW-39 family protein n=1 Tax=Nesterenkonia flava TaxID=469799 RepID=A0ABU1FU01_9MICC|nr:DLW-39 family protein [Nesterenkonia flava]MDR5711812.1 DLW-39 family protein [Nesterenkonia flava]
MKTLVLTAAAVAGFVVYRRWKQAEETRDVWSQATDSVKDR